MTSRDRHNGYDAAEATVRTMYEWTVVIVFRPFGGQNMPYGSRDGCWPREPNRGRCARSAVRYRGDRGTYAVATRWGGTVLLALCIAIPANGQERAEHDAWSELDARHQTMGNELPSVSGVLPVATEGGDAYGFTITVWGITDPITRPGESWLRITCAPADPRWRHNETDHGSDLVRIHVALYDSESEQVWDTSDGVPDGYFEGGICDLDAPIDDTFMDFPRNLDVAWAFVWPSPTTRQNVEVVSITYQAFTMAPPSTR